MRACAFMRWEGLIDVVFNELGFLTFVFDKEENMNVALELGRVVFQDVFRDSVLVFRPWQDREGFSHLDMVAQFSWVTMYNIPLTLKNREGICYIASAIGKVICLEQPTPEVEEVEADRLLIHLDRRENKPSCVWVQILNDDLAYVNLPVRLTYQETVNPSLVARYFPRKHDHMFFKVSTFLGCPVSFDRLDYFIDAGNCTSEESAERVGNSNMKGRGRILGEPKT